MTTFHVKDPRSGQSRDLELSHSRGGLPVSKGGRQIQCYCRECIEKRAARAAKAEEANETSKL